MKRTPQKINEMHNTANRKGKMRQKRKGKRGREGNDTTKVKLKYKQQHIRKEESRRADKKGKCVKGT